MFAWVIKMLQYERTDVLEGIDINKSSKSNECVLCHYGYFKGIGYKFEPYACNGCHGVSMMVYDLNDISIVNVKFVDYRYVLWNMTENDGINRLNKSKLDDKGTLWIWTLVQVRHLLK